MIGLPRPLLRRIRAAAEEAYPAECCGLLVGRRDGQGGVEVTAIEPSPNVAASGNDRFEVDPRVRLDVMRALEGGPEDIIGHYHSHPDHPAEPSARDLEMAFEPDLVWVIAAVDKGRATEVRAHVLDTSGDRFRELEVHARDPSP